MDKQRTWNSRAAIILLTAFHVVAGVVMALFAANQPAVSSALFISLVFCQTSLVGMWCGFGHTHWMLRLIGLAVGVVLLTVLLCLGLESDPRTLLFLLVFVATLVVAAVTWCVRRLKARLVRVGVATASSREGLQFTIRHLMLFTLAVACLVTLGKLSAPYLPGIDLGARLLVLALCFVAVALASIWAMLGSGSPVLRMMPVLAIAGASGAVAALAFAHTGYVFWVSLTMLEALYLAGSLGVVRRCGYRLAAIR